MIQSTIPALINKTKTSGGSQSPCNAYCCTGVAAANTPTAR